MGKFNKSKKCDTDETLRHTTIKCPFKSILKDPNLLPIFKCVSINMIYTIITTIRHCEKALYEPTKQSHNVLEIASSQQSCSSQ